jgi:hypothetical protein
VEFRAALSRRVDVVTIDPDGGRSEEAPALDIVFRDEDFNYLDLGAMLVRDASRQVDRWLTIRASLEVENLNECCGVGVH